MRHWGSCCEQKVGWLYTGQQRYTELASGQFVASWRLEEERSDRGGELPATTVSGGELPATTVNNGQIW